MKLEKQKWTYNVTRFDFPYRMDWTRVGYWFSREAWDRSTHPSFASFLAAVWDNALVRLTPWYSWRRSMLQAFVNRNGTKLLFLNRAMASVRTRDQVYYVYYRLVCGFLFAQLYRRVFVKKATGEKCNIFGVSILCGFDKDNFGDYEERTEKVLSGLCLTRRQCQRLLDRIVAATPDCGWY